jgi:hypothetical protein
MSKKRKTKHPWLNEFLFWLHTAIILAALLAGLFIPIRWVLALLVAIKLQQIAFHGCVLTNLEIKTGGIGKRRTYFELAVRRFLGLRINRSGDTVVTILVAIAAFGVALIAAHYNYRLHI